MLGRLEDRIGGIERVLSQVEVQPGQVHGAPADPASRGPEPSVSSQPSAEHEIVIQDEAIQASTSAENDDADGTGIVPLTSREDCAFFGMLLFTDFI